MASLSVIFCGSNSVFPNLNEWLREKRFESNDEFIAYFEGLGRSYYFEVINKSEFTGGYSDKHNGLIDARIVHR